jgi:very-short-patch-repair endonuclease
MNVERTPIPSPLAGEGASRSEAGEGLGGRVLRGGFAGSREPSPGRSLRSQPASPARGEGKVAVSLGRETKLRARALRGGMTDAERKLWYALRDRRFEKFKFRRQVPVGRFIVDFVCFEARIVIEVDGGQHADSLSDRRRDRWLIGNGFQVLRFWNNEVLRNFAGVMTVLAQALKVEWS